MELRHDESGFVLQFNARMALQRWVQLHKEGRFEVKLRTPAYGLLTLWSSRRSFFRRLIVTCSMCEVIGFRLGLVIREELSAESNILVLWSAGFLKYYCTAVVHVVGSLRFKE